MKHAIVFILLLLATSSKVNAHVDADNPSAYGTTMVRTYGAIPDDGIDDTQPIRNAINAAIATNSPQVILFEAGRYDLISAGTANFYIRILNGNNITLKGVTVNNEPATKLVRFNNGVENAVLPFLFQIRFSKNITVENLVFDNDPYYYTAGVVTEKAGTTVTVDILPGHPMNILKPYIMGVYDMANNKNKTLRTTWDTNLPTWAPVAGGSGRLLRLDYGALASEVNIGDGVFWFQGNHGGTQCVTGKSENITFNNIVTNNSTGFVYHFVDNKDITLNRVKIEPVGNRIAVSPRDGIHFAHCTGLISLDSVVVKNTPGDDGLNVHGEYLSVGSISGRTITFAESVVADMKVNSRIQFLDANFQPVWTGTVESATPEIVNSSSKVTVVLKETPPAWIVPGTFASPLDWLPKAFIVKNSIFENTGRFGITAKTTNVVIDSSRFRYNANAGIALGSSYNSFFKEAQPAWNIVVKNNLFENNVRRMGTLGPGGVLIDQLFVDNPNVNGNLYLFKNRFIDETHAYNIRDAMNIHLWNNVYNNVTTPILRNSPTTSNFTQSIVYDDYVTNDLSKGAIHYSETWNVSSNTADSLGTVTWNNKAGSFAEFNFVGNYIAYYARKGQYMGKVDVYLDGSLVLHDFDLYSSAPQTKFLVYSNTNLPNTVHTLRIVNTGLKNENALGSYVNIDFLVHRLGDYVDAKVISCAVPSVTTQPVDCVKIYGDTAQFSFAATGTAITYQWQINTGSGFTNITETESNPGNIYTGFNAAQLNIASLTVAMSGYQYQCLITNSCGNMVTNVVSLTVNPATATIAVNNKAKTYGENNPTLNAVVSGTINGDVLNYTLATTAEKFSAVNSYAITVSLSSNPDYDITVTDGTLQVNKRTLHVTATSGNSKVYDGTTVASVTTDAFNTTANVKITDDRVNNDALNIEYADADFDSKIVSTSHIITVSGLTITGAAAGNYELSETSVSTTNNAVIAAKDLTVSATGINKTFDGSATANVQLSTDKLGGDDVSVSFTAASFADFNTGTWDVTVTGITICGNDVGNYTLLNNNTSTNASITKAGTTTALITSAATVRYMDPLTITAKIKPENTAQPLTGTVQFSIGGVPYGSPVTIVPVPGDTDGTVQATMTPQVSNLPALNPYSVTVVFSSNNINYSGSNQSTSVTVLQRTASPYNDNIGFFTGTLFAWTSNATSNSASVTLSTTIRDNSAPRGDMRGARVTFYIVNGTTLTPINGAQNLPVGLIDINDGSVGTASAIVNFNIGSNNAQNFLIAVGVSGAYTNNPNSSLAQTIVTVSKPVPGGYMVGGGRIENISSSGYIKGQSGLNTDFQADISYTKSGTNPKGKANVLVRSYYRTDGTLDTELHTYIIATTAISSLNVGAPTATATFSAKANLYEQMPDLSLVQIEGGSTFEMVIYQNGCDQKAAITLYRKAGGVWYSSNWSGTGTIQQSLNGGEVYVTGGGSCSAPAITRTNSFTGEPELSASVSLAVKAYPNPSNTFFSIKIESSDVTELIQVRVLHVTGREIEIRSNITAGQVIELGQGYFPGMYIIEVLQGEKKKLMKLVKQ